MVIMLASPADAESIKKASQDLDGYVKFVVDLKRRIMTIGGQRHYQGEQLLLQDGSHQTDLLGGAVNLGRHPHPPRPLGLTTSSK